MQRFTGILNTSKTIYYTKNVNSRHLENVKDNVLIISITIKRSLQNEYTKCLCEIFLKISLFYENIQYDRQTDNEAF